MPDDETHEWMFPGNPEPPDWTLDWEALAKTDPARQKTVLYVTAEVVRQIAILALPVMPESAARLLDSLGVPAGERNFASLGGSKRIAPGTSLPAPVGVFPRYVEPKEPTDGQ